VVVAAGVVWSTGEAAAADVPVISEATLSVEAAAGTAGGVGTGVAVRLVDMPVP